MNTFQKISINGLVVFVVGMLYAILAMIIYNNNRILLLGLMGSIYGLVICSIFNLIYFIKTSGFTKFLTPGISCIILMIIIFYGNTTDILYFESMALSNLLMGIFWFKKTDIH